MANYYVNKNVDNRGDHEVHREGCAWMPSERDYLGDHANCHTAVAAAKQRYTRTNGCIHCSPACHTS